MRFYLSYVPDRAAVISALAIENTVLKADPQPTSALTEDPLQTPPFSVLDFAFTWRWPSPLCERTAGEFSRTIEFVLTAGVGSALMLAAAVAARVLKV